MKTLIIFAQRLAEAVKTHQHYSHFSLGKGTKKKEEEINS